MKLNVGRIWMKNEIHSLAKYNRDTKMEAQEIYCS